jgi:hypothetical protein
MRNRFHRKNSSQKKRSQKSKSSKSLYVQCEGETERNYFQLLFDRDSISAEFKLKSKLNLETPIIKQEIKKLIEKGYHIDEIIYIYDSENCESQINLFKTIREFKYSPKLFITSSCFEVWFILHFQELFPNQYFSPSDRYKNLETVCPGYNKPPTKAFIIEKFIPLLDDALKNSSILFDSAIKQNIFSTYSEIHLFINSLLDEYNT